MKKGTYARFRCEAKALLATQSLEASGNAIAGSLFTTLDGQWDQINDGLTSVCLATGAVL